MKIIQEKCQENIFQVSNMKIIQEKCQENIFQVTT
jgi:hypothetical protein